MKTLVLLFIIITSANCQETRLKTHIVQDKIEFSLNARERKGIPLNLPENTVAWYYVFSTSPNKEGNQSLQLLSGVLNALPFATSKSLAQITDKVATPKGYFPCDVYLTDKKGRDSYLETDFMNAWKILSPAHWKESLTGGMSGKMCVTSVRSGTVYLCFGNEAFTSGGYAALEVVALVPDNSIWNGEQIDGLYNILLELYNKTFEGKDDNIGGFLARCITDKIISSNLTTPEELQSMSIYNRNKICKEFEDECTDAYFEMAEKEEKQAKTTTKAYDYGNMAWSYYEEGDVDKCIEYSKKAIELEPELTYAKANCGLCLLEKGLTDEATEYYLDAADEFKEYGEKEDFQYMIEDLEKAIAKKPDMKGASIILKMLRSKQWW